MAKFILGIMCMVISVLAGSHPAFAVDLPTNSDTTTTVIALGFFNLPVTGGQINVWAATTWTDGKLVTREAYVTTMTSDVVSDHYVLAPADLVVNATLTRGLLRLPDGSLLTWTSNGDGVTSTSDFTDRHGRKRYRQIEHQITHDARVTGTLRGLNIDAQGSLEDPYDSDEQAFRPPFIYRTQMREITHISVSQ